MYLNCVAHMATPVLKRRALCLWSDIVGEIFMEELDFEWVLDGYLHQTLIGSKVLLKCQAFSHLPA